MTLTELTARLREAPETLDMELVVRLHGRSYAIEVAGVEDHGRGAARRVVLLLQAITW